MILFFSRFVHLLSRSPLVHSVVYQTKRTSCPGPGTFVNGTGGCECSAETPFGDPESSGGCWGCNPPCDLNAQCVSKDQCKCNEGFIGDGLDICEKPIPTLQDFNPKSGTVEGGVGVYFRIFVNATNYTVTKAYCRFGPVIVDSTEYNSTFIKCITQKNKAGEVQVQVGFDAIHWSSQEFLFRFFSKGTNSFQLFFYIFTIFLISILIVFVFWFFKKQNEYADNAEEMLPLNKWHMNTPHITPQAEKSWLDFLWNISIE